MGTRRRIVSWVAGILALVILAGATYTGYRGYKDAQFKRQACAVIKDQQAERGPIIDIPGDGERVAVIGDSYSSGDTLANYRDAWPFAFAAATGTSVTLSGIGWTGFVDSGVCDTDAFGTRLAVTDNADVVIVQGGLNDTDTASEVQAAAAELLQMIDAPRIVVVGPVDAPAVNGEKAVDTALHNAADTAGAEYVSALDWSLTFGSDQTHLDPQGYASFAGDVADAMDAN